MYSYHKFIEEFDLDYIDVEQDIVISQKVIYSKGILYFLTSKLASKLFLTHI